VGSRLAVNPARYEAASFAFGVEIAGGVYRAGLGVVEGLAHSVGMAGSDPAGASWAAAYDDAAAAAVATTQDVVNGCYRLAALLQQTGFNYSRAESDSTAGGGDLLIDSTAYADCSVHLGQPATASGGVLPSPAGWWLIEHAVSRVWPGGDQARLRTAAASWSDAALSIGDAALYVQDALACVAAQVSPEVDDAITACRAMDRHLWELVAGYRDMARACSEFASYIDRTRSEVEHELASLVEWTVGIQAGGAVLAVITGGASEVGAQGAQAGRVATAAAKVGAIIEALAQAAAIVANAIAITTARLLQISRDLKPLLGTRIVIGATEKAEALPAMRTAEAIAERRLAEVGTGDAANVLTFADKGAARASLDGDLQTACNRFFRDATAKSQDFQVMRRSNGSVQMQFFSPANNPGYGKLYVQIVDSSGQIVTEYKDTIGPGGLIERKWIHGGS
jgi:hypothetical protein